MKKLLYVIFIIVILLMSLSLQGCKEKAPNENDIKSVLQSEDLDGYTVNNVTIDKSQIDDNFAQYWCTVEMENETYIIDVAYEVAYEYYDTGGWIIEKISDVGRINCVPIAGVSDYEALSCLEEELEYSDRMYNNLTIVEHTTDLNSGIDTVKFSYNNTGELLDSKGTITVTFEIDSSGEWDIWDDSISISQEETVFHPTGIWENYIGADYTCYLEFESYTDTTVSVAEYHVDDYDGYYFVVYYTFVYEMNSEGEVSFGDYVVTPDSICYWTGDEMSSVSEVDNSYNLYLFTAYDYSYEGDMSDAVEPPDVAGMTVTEATDLIENLGLKLYDDDDGNVNFYNYPKVVNGIATPDGSGEFDAEEDGKLKRGSYIVFTY